MRAAAAAMRSESTIAGSTVLIGLLLAIGCGPGLLGGNGSGDGSAGETASTGDSQLSAEDGLTMRADTTGSESSTTGDTTTTSTSVDADTTTGEPALPMLVLGFSPIKQFDFSWMPWPGATHYQLLERVTPDDAYVQIGSDLVETSISFTMPLHLRFGASYVLRACDAVDCVESEPVEVMSSMAEAVGYVKASNTDGGDSFGYRVALSDDGSTLAVGADEEDSSATEIDGDQADDAYSGAGAVYVFVRDESDEWTQQAYLKVSNGFYGHRFGSAVALSHDGSTLAAGAMDETSAAIGINGDQSHGQLGDAGAAYVFVRDEAGQWMQQAYVKASNTGLGDHFGAALALNDDGDTLAVGAFSEDSDATGIDGNQANDVASGSGAVYVYVRDEAGQWTQQAYVKASNTHANGEFGRAVALDGEGDTLAVGAAYESSAATGIDGDQTNVGASQSGAVYVFVRSDTNEWSQQAYVKASNTDTADFFGGAVALSGDGSTMAVGAIFEDGGASGIDGEQDDDSTPYAGATYVFVRGEGGQWSQEAYVKASNNGYPFRFGSAVAVSHDGQVLAVSAPSESSQASGIGGDQGDQSLPNGGAVYVFVRDAATGWGQRAYVKAANPGVAVAFGDAVALSGNGEIMAVGCVSEQSSAVGIGGEQQNTDAPDAGAVYLY